MKALLKKFLDVTFLKFLLVGVCNTLVGYGVAFVLLNLAHCGYWFSSAMNYVCGSILSYFLNKHFTFRDSSRDLRTVLRFAANIAVCYLIAYGVAKPLAGWALSGASEIIKDNLAMLAGVGIFTVLNYLGQRILVFRKNGKSDGSGDSSGDGE